MNRLSHALERGTLQALIERYSRQRLPRILRIRSAMENGEKLETRDLAFLHEVLSTASRIKPWVDRHPDYQDTYARTIMLCLSITTLALENETR